MTLPTFLGIGVPRAGTTWLHTLLSAHPEVYLPSRRKEVRYFDRHHDRGPGWYEGFFCTSEEARDYTAIGEISPQYLYCDECPGRISALLPTAKLVVMLRHPVNRAYSQFGFVIQRRDFRGTFEEFVATRPRALEMGFYSRYLEGYVRRFDRTRILPIVFEEAVSGRGEVRRDLAGFLGISEERFADATDRVNPSTVPRFRSLSSFAVKTGRRLRRHHLESLVDVAGRLGLRRLLTSGSRVPPLDPGLKRELSQMYADEFEELERSWGIDLSSWKDRTSIAGSGVPDASEIRGST
ncbi:MAG: sulfotransferase [Actinomycetota bacterium]|nr:sulfotransferase [Actinomycetota bacterium]